MRLVGCQLGQFSALWRQFDLSISGDGHAGCYLVGTLTSGPGRFGYLPAYGYGGICRYAEFWRETTQKIADTCDVIFENLVFLDDPGAALDGQYQIVAVDEFVASSVSENFCNYAALAARDSGCVCIGIGGETARHFIAVCGADNDRVAPFKRPLDAHNTGRKQAFPLFERMFGARINEDFADRIERTDNPTFSRCERGC